MATQFDSRRAELTRSLVTLYRRQATDADKAAGLAWYPHARRIVAEWSETYGIHTMTVACVVAALSPQVEWSRNLIIADDVLAGRVPSIGGAIRANVDKARGMLADKTLTTMHRMPHGPKVYHFSCNLSGDVDAVTIDTHAMQAALADVCADYRLGWGPYLVFADCYVAAAKHVGLAPCDFQAVLWHTWKRLHPRSAKSAARNKWPTDDTIED